MQTEQQLANLLHEYALLIDQGKLAEVGQLLQHCTILDPFGNTLATGQEEITTMYQGMVRIYPESETPRTQHVVSNFTVLDLSKEQSKTRAYFNVQQRKSSGSIETIICGRYENCFKKLNGVWCITQHQMFPTEIDDMSEHLLIDLGLS